MELKFFSIEEVKEFVKQLKGVRGGKGDVEETVAPKPIEPPKEAATPFTGASSGFAPPVAGAGPTGAGPFAAAAPSVAPEVQGLVIRISNKIDQAIASGGAVNDALAWFRNQCGSEAANATMDQIKSNFLAKLDLKKLDDIAKAMNA